MVKIEKIVISGYYGFNNLGDEAILKAWVEGLKDEFELVILSNQPQKTAKSYGVKAINRYNLFAFILELRQAELFISGGGGLLQDISGFFSLFYYLFLLFLAQLLKVKTYFAAQGVGPISSDFKKSLTAFILNRVDLITVRDLKSKQLLIESGVKNKITITRDLALTIAKGDNQQGEKLLKEAGIKLKQPIFAVVIRNWQDNDYLGKLALILEELISQYQLKILIIPFKYPADLELSRKLAKRIDGSVSLLSTDYSIKEMANIISRVDFLLALRLHALIFAVVNQIPTVGIAYDPKINNFLAQIDLKALADIDSLEVERDSQKLISLWQTREALKVEDEQLAEMLALAWLNLNFAKRLVKTDEAKD